MSDQARLNANAHLVSVDDEVQTFPGTVDAGEAAGFVLGSIVRGDGAGNYLLADANVEAEQDSIAGISAGVYAAAATAAIHGDGSLVTGLAGLTPDAEYYADPTTGLLGLIGDIASGEWTMLMGRARTATTFKIGMGSVFRVV